MSIHSDETGAQESTRLLEQPRDRFSVVVGYAIFFVIASILTGIAYVVWAGLLSPQPPRTATERQLLVLKGVTDKNPSFPEAWADYANALMDAGQLSQAGSVVAQGLSRCTTDTPIEVAQGRLQIMQGDPNGAVKTLDKAIAAADSVRAKMHAQEAAAGVKSEVEPYGSASIIQASILEARLFWQRQDYPKAQNALTRALAEDPTMTDVLTMRGDVYSKLGDKTHARTDYRAALQYVPNYAPALSGLKKLG